MLRFKNYKNKQAKKKKLVVSAGILVNFSPKKTFVICLPVKKKQKRQIMNLAWIIITYQDCTDKIVFKLFCASVYRKSYVCIFSGILNLRKTREINFLELLGAR